MLNLSKIRVDGKIDKEKYSVFGRLDSRSVHSILPRLILGLGIVGLITLFLPWTQNIRSGGYVSTLNPYDKPQDVQSLIAGRIESWKVVEGDTVQVGDTLVIISESKSEYLDPMLLDRTEEQLQAKLSTIDAYDQKVRNLKDQAQALLLVKDAKLNQNVIKIQQVGLKIVSDSLELVAAETKLMNATNQRNRTEDLYDKGLKSLTEIEGKRLSVESSQAKVTKILNSISDLQIEKDKLIQEADAIVSEFNEKQAKLKADINTTLSYKYESIGESSKLESKVSNYERRKNAYAVTAPITGIITQALKEGIGEFLKEGDGVATIFPLTYQKSVELYVNPVDVPLLIKGENVRIQFDGWPAIVFSGWPENSFGTFEGMVYAIDNNISDNGKYRVLVVESPDAPAWPELIKVGGGAQALFLLNRVPMYYEIWRQMNGFPPDYYKQQSGKDVKFKAPIRKVK